MPRHLCIFYSAAHLYLEQWAALSPDDSGLADVFVDCPGGEPSHTLAYVAHKVSGLLAEESLFERVYTPGMWLVHDLLQEMVSRGWSDYHFMSCRTYRDAEGVGYKVQWGSGYAAQHNATHVLDIGGEGKMKLLQGDTGEELWSSSGNVAVAEWKTVIDGVLESQIGEGRSLVIGCTGKWRGGPGGHADAGRVVASLRDDYAEDRRVVNVEVVTETLERRWEHASALQAREVLIGEEVTYDRVFTVGSGSSSTQVGDSGSSTCGITMPLGIHVTGALAGGGLEQLRASMKRHCTGLLCHPSPHTPHRCTLS